MLLPIMRQRTATYRLSQLQALIHDVSLHINAFLFDNKYLCGHMYRAFYQFFFPKKATLLKNTQVTWTGPYSLHNHILGTP